ncbi:MAG: HAMP domain-containing sensor histidine kinase, partial [Myxococcota bacterium]
IPFAEQFRRVLFGALIKRRGEVRATQDLRRLGDVARLAGVFSATMLAPIAFLAFLALSSVRSEELSLDADLQSRGRGLTDQLQDELDEKFGRFEAAVRERLRRSESPAANLGELSPYLRAVFRFDGDGQLAAPFLIEPRDLPQPPLGWHRAARAARALEASDPARANDAWRRARELTVDPVAVGESMLGEARTSPPFRATVILADLYSDHALDRDQRGFRFGDLARLELARIRYGTGSDSSAADAVLIDLVDTILASPWTIGREGEPAVVRDALRTLEGRADPDWIARSRSRLNELHAQLNWAELVRDEIELVYSRVPEGEFRYVGARFDSPAVWAIVRSGESTYTFSFSAPELFDDLEASVLKATEIDRDLTAALYVAEEPPNTAFSARPLGPWLPVATLAVSPKDPAALERNKSRRIVVRVAIVFTAVFIAVAGALWITRIVAWEVETARQRADFAANVSHELRSPITQIRLKGEALQLGLVDPGDDMQQHFDAIVRESERLSRLVDNVLDFAAIERRAKRYQLRPDDLSTVVSGGVESGRAAFEAAGFTVELDLPDQLPPLWLDRDAIGQVMTNLLSNALKYGAEGKWVAVRLVARTDSVELSVADRGCGISAAELPHVFDDFFRSADPRVRSTKGTGIGLAIVRYIVEAHGGTIRVDSTLGRGARFVVQLPLEPPEGAGVRS